MPTAYVFSFLSFYGEIIPELSPNTHYICLTAAVPLLKYLVVLSYFDKLNIKNGYLLLVSDFMPVLVHFCSFL